MGSFLLTSTLPNCTQLSCRSFGSFAASSSEMVFEPSALARLMAAPTQVPETLTLGAAMRSLRQLC
jgi:hypothetical protein